MNELQRRINFTRALAFPVLVIFSILTFSYGFWKMLGFHQLAFRLSIIDRCFGIGGALASWEYR